jgi:hypothetical protein
LSAGSIVGGDAVAKADPARGASCITERRAVEILEQGDARTRIFAMAAVSASKC